MATGRRPGGLTALAVLNFVFAGLSLLSVLATVFVFAYANTLKEAAHKPEDRAMLEALENMNTSLWVLIVVSSILATVLLIVAGIGYLKMRGWGRSVGNLYAITAIASGTLGAVMTPEEIGGGFNIGTIIGLVYPVLTLYFINATFKDDLTSGSSQPPAPPQVPEARVVS
jgi:hypothetical protein